MYKKTAFPRSSRGLSTAKISSMSNFIVKEHILPCQYIRDYPGATLHDQEDELELHINQYIPDDGSASLPGAVTIIGAHANGFPKELYEPLWEDLCKSLKDHGQAIRSIWIADVCAQGKSGELNEDKLGNDQSWSDHARDLLLMINHFRRDMPRPLVGIGHSMGGNSLVNLALMHPRLLSAIVLIDPVIQITAATPPAKNSNIARLSTFRRDVWPSKAEAAASFRKNKFYQTWDPRVLDLFVLHGLRELTTTRFPDTVAKETSQSSSGKSSVTLTTSKHQEAFSYLRPNFDGLNKDGERVQNRETHPDIDLADEEIYPFYRPEIRKMYEQLPHLRPSTLYVLGGQSSLSTPEGRKPRLAITGTGVGGSGGVVEGRVKEVVFEDVGHLLAFENVKDVADAIGDWTAGELERWGKAEKEWRDQWQAKSREERTMITEAWKRNMGGDPRNPSSGKL